jgi:integrase
MVSHLTAKVSRLTAKRVENAKPQASRYELSDNGSAFRLIVQPSGHKSFATRVWYDGGQVKLTLGDADHVSLADARAMAAMAAKDARNGIDPRKAKKDAKAQRALADANTFAAVAQLYLNSDKTKALRSADQSRDKLERLIIPKIGGMPVANLKRSHYVAVLDHIEKHHGGPTADRALSSLWQVLKYYAKRSDDFVIPLIPGMNRTSIKARARDRILSDDEIKKVWATGDRFVRFLLLTAARRSEVSDMQWREIKDGVWTLPASRNKTKVDLIRPLSKAALATLPARGDDDDYVFAHTPGKPLRTYSRLVKQVHRASGTSNWRFHDLRRSSRSLLSRAGVSADIAEIVLGHTLKGVRATYDRHSYAAEKARALEALAHQIALIINPPRGNVRQLRRA